MKHLCSTLSFLFLLTPFIAAAEESAFLRTISVSGAGTVSTKPDLATILSGVVTTAPTAGDALKANSTAMESIMATIKNHGIADKDIQTSNFNVYPQYERDQRGAMDTNKIVGYQVSNNLSIRVRDLEQLGALLDALVQSGSNEVSGIQFSIDEPEGLLDQARRSAIRNARERAELYAEAAGVKVGKVLSISEQAVDIPRPQHMERMAFAMAADSSVPVAVGEQELRATINVLFELAE